MAEGGVVSPVSCSRLEAAIVRSFRQLRERFLQRGRTQPEAGGESPLESPIDSLLDSLPVDMQLYIMSFLSPQDLCILGVTNHYWHLMVKDYLNRLNWKYTLLQDFPLWSSTDCRRLLDLDILKTCKSESPEGNDLDYRSIYFKSCPKPRKPMQSRHSVYSNNTSFQQLHVKQSEPHFAMLGPGLEMLRDSLVAHLMNSPDLCPVSIQHTSIYGIDPWIILQLGGRYKCSISVLFSEFQVRNRHVFRILLYKLNKVCSLVEGFIFVANAETNLSDSFKENLSEMLLMMDPLMGPQTRPLLVLACLSHPRNQRIPCVYLAHDLCLNNLNRPWMMQNTDAFTLSGLLDGIEWIVAEVGKK